MPTLHLGVIDIPYSRRQAGRGRKKSSGTQTTGDVAGWLENKYHIMEIFFRENESDLMDKIANSISSAVEAMAMGAPSSIDPFGSATSGMEDRFKQFLSNREMDRLGYPGIPTKVSLAGVSHRFKRPYVKRGPRPSFVDTGLYQSSMRAWLD